MNARVVRLGRGKHEARKVPNAFDGIAGYLADGGGPGVVVLCVNKSNNPTSVDRLVEFGTGRDRTW
jgi:hypothetical protein